MTKLKEYALAALGFVILMAPAVITRILVHKAVAYLFDRIENRKK